MHCIAFPFLAFLEAKSIFRFIDAQNFGAIGPILFTTSRRTFSFSEGHHFCSQTLGYELTVFAQMDRCHVLRCLVHSQEFGGKIDRGSRPVSRLRISTVSAADSDLTNHDGLIPSLCVRFYVFKGCFKDLNMLSHQTLVRRKTIKVTGHKQCSRWTTGHLGLRLLLTR